MNKIRHFYVEWGGKKGREKDLFNLQKDADTGTVESIQSEELVNQAGGALGSLL